jgi:hypothetical protein
MSAEPAEARKHKRIIENIIGGFGCAKDAIIFGHTVEKIITENIGAVKFKQHIGSLETTLAITDLYIGETTLKIIFLDVKNQNDAQFICDKIKKLTNLHSETYHAALSIEQQLIRGKPQPQYIGT